MKKAAFFLAAAAMLGALPVALRMGVVSGALLLVALGVAFAVAASEGVHALAVTGGAAAAVAGTLLGSTTPAVAGALLVALAFVERTTRVRGNGARAAHVGAALVGGAMAGTLVHAHDGAALPVQLVAITVGAVLVSVPLLVEADDPIAHALDQAALDVPAGSAGSLRAMLVDAAQLRRSARDVPLSADAVQRVEGTWSSLVRLADSRVRLDRRGGSVPLQTTAATAGAEVQPTAVQSVARLLDERVAQHVSALCRAYSAVDAARAAAVGLDDTQLEGAVTLGESEDEVSRALLELQSAQAEPKA